jgi:hypothetical protein
MRKVLLVAMLLGGLLCGLGGCCRLRKGFVLRGDWSIELNRVPHLASHGPCYACTGCQGCAAEGAATTPAGTAAPAESLPVPPDRAAAAPQRFLPVPTRPAFQPAFDAWQPGPGSPVPITDRVPIEESGPVELRPPEEPDSESEALAPMPPQPNELRLRPLSTAHARPAAEGVTAKSSPAARVARTNTQQKGQHRRIHPRGRW